jgi:hypothetical protein
VDENSHNSGVKFQKNFEGIGPKIFSNAKKDRNFAYNLSGSPKNLNDLGQFPQGPSGIGIRQHIANNFEKNSFTKDESVISSYNKSKNHLLKRNSKSKKSNFDIITTQRSFNTGSETPRLPQRSVTGKTNLNMKNIPLMSLKARLTNSQLGSKPIPPKNFFDIVLQGDQTTTANRAAHGKNSQEIGNNSVNSNGVSRSMNRIPGNIKIPKNKINNNNNARPTNIIIGSPHKKSFGKYGNNARIDSLIEGSVSRQAGNGGVNAFDKSNSKVANGNIYGEGNLSVSRDYNNGTNFDNNSRINNLLHKGNEVQGGVPVNKSVNAKGNSFGVMRESSSNDRNILSRYFKNLNFNEIPISNLQSYVHSNNKSSLTNERKASPQLFQTQEGPGSKNQFFNHNKKRTANTSSNNNPNRPTTNRIPGSFNRYINSHQNFDNPVNNSYNTVEQGIYQRKNTTSSKLKGNRNSRGQESINRTIESQLKVRDNTSPYANFRQNNDGKKIKAHLLYENGSTKHILKDLVHKVSSNLYYDFSKVSFPKEHSSRNKNRNIQAGRASNSGVKKAQLRTAACLCRAVCSACRGLPEMSKSRASRIWPNL